MNHYRVISIENEHFLLPRTEGNGFPPKPQWLYAVLVSTITMCVFLAVFWPQMTLQWPGTDIYTRHEWPDSRLSRPASLPQSDQQSDADKQAPISNKTWYTSINSFDMQHLSISLPLSLSISFPLSPVLRMASPRVGSGSSLRTEHFIREESTHEDGCVAIMYAT